MITLRGGRLSLCCSLLCLLLGCVSSEAIIATVGTDVTLICNYDVQTYGKLSVCWGRGAIPSRGCASEVIRSDGTTVSSKLSDRYLLSGNLDEGDVSLTITQLVESDSGMYGCRVEIPGWFNDHKHQLMLTVVAAPPNPLKVETREVRERSVTVRWTSAFDGGRPITSYRVNIKNKQESWNSALSTEITNPEVIQVTIFDLRPAMAYNLCMFAANSVGMSASSNVLTITTKEAAPEGPPLDIYLKALSSRMIIVTWKPPRPELRNGVLRGYKILYREYDPADKQPNSWLYRSVTATRESTVLTDLEPSTKYRVVIQAKTNAGFGPTSTDLLCSTMDEVHTTTKVASVESPSTAATKRRQDISSSPAAYTTTTVESSTASTVWTQSTTSIMSVHPDPPVVKLKAVRGNTITLSWTPGSQGGSPITRFLLKYKALDAPWDYTRIDFSPNQTEATLIEMHNSTYIICMFAMNSQGTSEASNVLTITAGEAGQQRVDVVFTTPSDTRAAAAVGESHNSHLAAIVMPLVLVVLIVVIVTTWQLRRIKRKQGSLSMWVTNGAIRIRGSESLQEL
ncbi:cell adhesion molecule DSCAM-like [Solea solea]|uniref:cell adhesion molecule DSCAM-like n=1 Tax=Solea solea TaxID=90069 RepID=UPI00272CD485|nr:cell adhesion molecule DSCAM-like [Solea solea]